MSDIKQANFRIAQDSADAFRAFCEEQGFSQAQGFDHLMQVLELDRAKAEVPGRATEIADFETHMKAILAAFVQSVALAENTEVRVREDYARRLESKDDTIQGLQAELKAAKDAIAAHAGTEAQLLAAQMELAQSQTDLRVLEDSKQILEEQCAKREADKQRIVDMLTEKLAVAEQKAAGYDALQAEHDRLATELAAALSEAKEQARNYEVASERAARAAEKALDAAVADERAKGAALASDLREALQEARIKAAEDLRAAEEKAHEADNAAAAEIRNLEKQLAAVQKELALLRK